MKILILNLTRFGDLLQTQPVVTGLVQQGGRAGLACLDNFSQASALLRHVDRVMPLSGARLLSLVDSAWPMAVGELEKWVAVAATFAPDKVVNLTPSVAGRLLAKRLGQVAGCEQHGFLLDDLGAGFETSGWARFLLVASGNRGVSPFNLVDLFRKTAGLGQEGRFFQLKDPDQEDMAWAAENLVLPKGKKGFICFQLGASEDKRRWPVAHFARLGELVSSEYGLVPVLLGTTAESHLGDKFLSIFPDAVNLQGKTSLPRLSAVLKTCGALVTGDTGTMHLAAGLGVGIVSIFLATAQPWDTGPYQEGAFCLEPDMDCHPCPFKSPCPHNNACRRKITPESVSRVVGRVLSGETGRLEGSGARIWITGKDEDIMGLRSLSGHDRTVRHAWIVLQRHFYRQFLDSGPFLPTVFPVEFCDRENADQLKNILDNAHQMLTLLEQQARLVAMSPKEVLKSKLLANWQLLLEIFSGHPYLSALGALFRFETQQASVSMEAFASIVVRYRSLCRAFSSSIM